MMGFTDPMVERERQRKLRAAQALPVRKGGLVSYNPTKAIPPPSPSDRQANLSAQVAGVKGVKPPKQDDGGFLGTLLNNPVGKAVTSVLGVLDVPRRAIISGLHEAADFGGDLATGSDRASFDDFMSQTKDPTYGVGKFVHTGNKWLDRGIGFAGDVALDPMTYLTFGAGKFAGTSGRVAAATRLSEAGLTEAAQRVGRLGVAGASKAEREIIFAGMKGAEELATPGLRFAGARIPGTERFAEAAGDALGKTRAAIGDTRVGQGFRNIRAPIGLEPAYKALARGEGNTADALGLIARDQSHAAASGMFFHRFGNDADRLAHELKKSGTGEQVFTALDEGLPFDHLPGGTQAKQFMGDVLEEAKAKVPTLEGRADFAPHVATEEFKKAVKGDIFKDVRQQVGLDVTEATGGAIKRSIHPGSKITLPDGSVIEFVADTAHGAVSARQINEKLGGAFGGIKVFETDIAKVLQPYVEGIADSVGRAEGLRKLAKIADIGGMDEVVDKAATKTAAGKRAKSIEREVKTVGKEQAHVAAQLDQGGARVKKDLTAAAEKQLEGAKAQLAAAQAAEKQAVGVRGGLEGQRKLVTRDAESAVSAAQKQLDALANEQRVLHEGAVSQKADIAQSARDAQLKRDSQGQAARRAQKRGEATVVPAGPIPETHAAREATGALDAHVAKQQAAIDARRDSVLGSMSQAEAKAAKSYDQIDAAKAAAGARQMGSKDAIATAKADLAEAQKTLARVKRAKVGTTGASHAAYSKIEKELDDVAKLVGTFDGSEDVSSLMSWYAKGVAELRDGKQLNDGLVLLGKAVKSGEIAPVMKQMIRDGYEQIGTSLLGDEGPIVRKELARQLAAMETALSDPAFMKVIDKYTQFFKTYATATLGFHARNGMSAAFMNATDGVSVRNMLRGADLWQKFDANPRTFMDNLPEWITPEQADDAVRAVFGSGGGSGQYGKAELRLGKNHLTNNRYTRLSQRLGGKVEGFARMGMSIDTILDGGTWEQAAARISRIHFDYSQVSRFDKTMKRIIPFWTFTSRNVPMQIQQMFLKPRMYQAYKSFARNMGQDYEGSMVPKSWQESGAFNITDGVWASPDLPHLRLQSDLEKLTTDPQRLLADVNPLFKVPFETMIAKRKMYSDTPFKQNGFESTDGGGLQLLTPLLSALGLTETAGDGTQVIDERLGYGLRGLLPPAAQIQRLFGGDPYYDGKQSQSIMNNLGIPVRLLTPAAKKAEQARREKAANATSASDLRRQALANWSNG